MKSILMTLFCHINILQLKNYIFIFFNNISKIKNESYDE